MWTRQLKWSVIASVVMGVSALSPLAHAQGSVTLDLDLKDAGLVSAVQALTNRTGLQFVIVDEESKFRPITLALRRASAEDAIQFMVEAAGGWVERNEAGVYIIRSGKPAGKPTVGSVAAPKAPVETRKIRLMKSDPKVVFQQILSAWTPDPYSAINDSNYVRNLTSYRPYQSGTINAVTSEGVIPLKSSDLDKQPLPENGNDITLPGETANQLGGGFPGGGAGGAGQGGGIGQGGGVGGQGGGQGGIAITPGQGLVPDGIEYLSYDPTDNSIIVRGTDEAIRQLQSAIALFDIAPKQVEVKVEFITTSQSVSRTFGIDWTFSRGAVFAGNNPGAFARTGDPIFLNYSTGNLVTRLRTQLIEGEGKVVSAPLVRTFNNQNGFISQNTTTTIFVPNQTVTQGVITTTFNPIPLTINTFLSVRPRINNDGTITMTLTPQVQQFGQIRTPPGGGQAIPDQLSSSIQIATRVKDGETILIAGFNTKQDNTSVTRFPILSDLPIIGSLFRSTSQNRNDSELLIFVTARVLHEDDDSFAP